MPTAGGVFAPPPVPFHLLELTLVSAQDLHRASCRRRMRAYAIAWAHPDHKVRTRPDPAGIWNATFVLPLDDAFLASPTSAVSVELFAARRHLPDRHLGTARFLLTALIPDPTASASAAAFYAAVLVRRPKTLVPQGILNVGVALRDGHLPLYSAAGPAASGDESERSAMLEKWKNELSVGHVGGARGARKRRRTVACFRWR